LKTADQKISTRRPYNRPVITRIILDNLISLVMMTVIPPNPPPRSGGSKGADEPFQSPFGDSPFG